MTELPDAELMERVRAGDLSAFDELYHRYSPAIRRFLFSLTWDHDLAEDYLQEVFVRLFRARERYEPTGRFSTFLFRIAKNYYLSQCRKNARLREVSLAEESQGGFRLSDTLIASERVEPEAHLMAEYRRWRIRRAIARLPEPRRIVFVLSHFEQMKQNEIAEILGVPLGTVKSRMFAAVRTLRSLLEEDDK